MANLSKNKTENNTKKCGLEIIKVKTDETQRAGQFLVFTFFLAQDDVETLSLMAIYRVMDTLLSHYPHFLHQLLEL